MINQFFNDESGGTMVEYAILVALLSVAVAVTVVLLSAAIKENFQTLIKCLKEPTSENCASG